MQSLAVNNNLIAETIDYWEDEKSRILRGAGTQSVLKRKKAISGLLPRWERQKQKRLEQAQTLLNGSHKIKLLTR